MQNQLLSGQPLNRRFVAVALCSPLLPVYSRENAALALSNTGYFPAGNQGLFLSQPYVPKMMSVRERYERQAQGHLLRLRKQIKHHKGLSLLWAANVVVNQSVNYMPEQGQRDRWQTPEETLGRKKGDCEDIALAKMYLLEQLGCSREKMFITYGISQMEEGGAFYRHSFLVVQSGHQLYALNNLALVRRIGSNSFIPTLKESMLGGHIPFVMMSAEPRPKIYGLSDSFIKTLRHQNNPNEVLPLVQTYLNPHSTHAQPSLR